MAKTDEQEQTEFAAFIGIDWADRKHAWALQTESGQSIEQGELDHTPEAVEAWAAELARRFGGRRVAVALEQSRGSLVFMLSKYAHLVLFPINPAMSVNYRRGFRPSGAKSDPSDAGLLLDLLVRHREKLRRLDPDTEETRTLQFLVEARRTFVNDKTRYGNRLTAHLKMYFPQVLVWFSEVSSQIVGDFLDLWPTLAQLQRAKPQTVRKFLVQHHSCKSDKVDCRLEEIRQAVSATDDAAVITANVAAATAMVRMIRELREVIDSYDKQIETLVKQHPDFAIFDSLPGAGKALVPRLIAALGTQRDRYNSAAELQCYSGIAPVLVSSGKQTWVHWRWACPKFVRQTFHEWAAHSVAYSPWAKAYYEQQRANGKLRNAVIRSLAFKWIRILFRCWQARTPYQEQLYQQVLATRTAARTDKTVNVQWKTSGGFSKIAGFTA